MNEDRQFIETMLKHKQDLLLGINRDKHIYLATHAVEEKILLQDIEWLKTHLDKKEV